MEEIVASGLGLILVPVPVGEILLLARINTLQVPVNSVSSVHTSVHPSALECVLGHSPSTLTVEM